MTQQSLIIRLKAVEEALAMYHNFCHKTLGYTLEDAMVNFGDKQLSDLRELIKEAEEQQEVAVLGIVYAPTNKPLYTALGEKP